jgi:hypothetical protein
MARKKRTTAVETITAALPNSDSAEGGQAGDLQGLSDTAAADSQSVRELAEEGQAFEAAAVDAIENAPSADAGEVTTRQVSEDDVPFEYTDRDADEPQE